MRSLPDCQPDKVILAVSFRRGFAKFTKKTTFGSLKSVNCVALMSTLKMEINANKSVAIKANIVAE